MRRLWLVVLRIFAWWRWERLVLLGIGLEQIRRERITSEGGGAKWREDQRLKAMQDRLFRIIGPSAYGKRWTKKIEGVARGLADLEG